MWNVIQSKCEPGVFFFFENKSRIIPSPVEQNNINRFVVFVVLVLPENQMDSAWCCVFTADLIIHCWFSPLAVAIWSSSWWLWLPVSLNSHRKIYLIFFYFCAFRSKAAPAAHSNQNQNTFASDVDFQAANIFILSFCIHHAKCSHYCHKSKWWSFEYT